MENNMVPVFDVNDIDLTRSAVIEASAGTGKTYTLENLVVKLLGESKESLGLAKEVTIEEVLIVTFTEKATSELQTRVREKIKSELDKKDLDETTRARLKKALDNFENNAISTIHGFCMQVLKQYAFENRKLFSLDVIDDSMLYEKTLHNLMRTKWKKEFGDNLLKVLEASEALKTDKWSDPVLDIAKNFRTAEIYSNKCGTFINPPYTEGFNPDEVENAKAQLIANTSVDLKNEIYHLKKEQGFISYDDMLSALFLSLQDNPLLLNVLRQRYAYAFVDEFQDTDPVQWGIFKQIFTGTENNRLFIIGDPKQAIYSFRGADVFTYENAKNSMINNGANYYSLSTNWRSLTGLIHSLNRLFKDKNWFSTSEIPKADYVEVFAPPSGSETAKVLEDQTLRGAFNIVDIDQEMNTSEAMNFMALFIAREIKYLLKDDRLDFIFYDKKLGKNRALRADDFCILIRKSSEAVLIEEVLKANHIPYTFYKKKGLYQSDEALHIKYLLESINEPADEQKFKKALLTRFFKIDISELWKYQEIPSDHGIKKLFEKWSGLADSRKWSLLFASILDDTGILFRELEEADAERRITNYQHILQNLELEANRKNLDLTGMLEALIRYSKNLVETDDDAELHRIESENPKVQIMTIHASKGLDFPIVFLAGGFKKSRASGFWKYHVNIGKDNEGLLFDLIKKGKDAKKIFDAENLYEEERLYYVALTRAIYKLYVPRYRPKLNAGHAGPVTKFFYNSVSAAFGDEEAEKVKILRALPTGGQELKLSGTCRGEFELKIPEPLFPDQNIEFSNRALKLFSFSKIKSMLDKSYVHSDMEEEKSYEISLQEKEDESHDESVDEEKKSLPAGNFTGSMLHEILEEISFGKVNKASSHIELLNDLEIKSLFLEKLDKYFLNNDLVKNEYMVSKDFFIEESARIIWHTLNTPIEVSGGESLVLGAIDDKDKLHEVEFYYKSEFLKESNAGVLNYPEDSMINGFIDLVFRHNGKFYFLDWKSNLLRHGYSRESIEKSINDSRYNLQYEIYTYAINKWLKNRVTDYDPKKHFGGILYLYLRGMNKEYPASGIFYVGP